jgi:hypothetical protein
MKTLIAILALSWAGTTTAAEERVIYEYKKYEKFDLGDLEVKGQLIAPGDLSVRERDRRRFELDLYNRAEFDDMTAHDINTLR